MPLEIGALLGVARVVKDAGNEVELVASTSWYTAAGCLMQLMWLFLLSSMGSFATFLVAIQTEGGWWIIPLVATPVFMIVALALVGRRRKRRNRLARQQYRKSQEAQVTAAAERRGALTTPASPTRAIGTHAALRAIDTAARHLQR